MSDKSRSERLHAVLAGQKIEEFKARHAYLHALSKGREEYGTFWLRSDNTTWGHTFGRMVGFWEMVPAHFSQPNVGFGPPDSGDGPPGGAALVVEAAPPEDGNISGPGNMIGGPSGRISSSKGRTDRPTKTSDIYGNTLYGHGQATFSAGCHVLSSAVIEVADDGLSARSFYLTPGTMLSVNGDQGGRSGMWLWERYGSDFVYRDGKWWWFHEQVCPDIAGDLDAENWAQDRFRKYIDKTLITGRASGPPRSGISDLRSAHSDISISQTVQDTVPAPEPYEKLDDEHSYSVGYNDFSGPLYPSGGGFGDYLY